MQSWLDGIRPIAVVPAIPGVHSGRYYFFGLVIRTATSPAQQSGTTATIPQIRSGDNFEYQLVQQILSATGQKTVIPKEQFANRQLPTGELSKAHQRYVTEMREIDAYYRDLQQREYTELQTALEREMQQLQTRSQPNEQKINVAVDVHNKYERESKKLQEQLQTQFQRDSMKLDFEFLDKIEFVQLPESDDSGEIQ